MPQAVLLWCWGIVLITICSKPGTYHNTFFTYMLLGKHKTPNISLYAYESSSQSRVFRLWGSLLILQCTQSNKCHLDLAVIATSAGGELLMLSLQHGTRLLCWHKPVCTSTKVFTRDRLAVQAGRQKSLQTITPSGALILWHNQKYFCSHLRTGKRATPLRSS